MPHRTQSKSSHAADPKQKANSTFNDDFDECSSLSEKNQTTTDNNVSPIYEDHVDDGFDRINESEAIMMEFHSNDIYLDKIKALSLKVNQQSLIIKEKDALIKRLRATMIGTDWNMNRNQIIDFFCLEMPRDQVTRDYLCHVVEKIRHQTTEHKYVGNLMHDARKLGIHVDKLNEILKLKHGITSIAREIFKAIVPESVRDVDNWNQLPESVIIKEKILIGKFYVVR